MRITVDIDDDPAELLGRVFNRPPEPTARPHREPDQPEEPEATTTATLLVL